MKISQLLTRTFLSFAVITLSIPSLQAQSRERHGNFDRGKGGGRDSRPGQFAQLDNNRPRSSVRPGSYHSSSTRSSRSPIARPPVPRRVPTSAATVNRGGRNDYRPYNRHPHYSPVNPGWRYHGVPRRNTVITTFNFSYQTINYGGYGYRYHNGCYYRPYRNAFIVVAPPPGIFISILPFGYRRIFVRSRPYYYYNGTYYQHNATNYSVVTPPLGAVVESIPEGYETLVVDGETYYKSDNAQYKPVVQENGEIWYEVIKVE